MPVYDEVTKKVLNMKKAQSPQIFEKIVPFLCIIKVLN
jgi:hypothetical protein